MLQKKANMAKGVISSWFIAALILSALVVHITFSLHNILFYLRGRKRLANPCRSLTVLSQIQYYIWSILRKMLGD